MVAAPVVGHDVRHAGAGGGLVELDLRFLGRHDAHGHDQHVLAPQRRDQGRLVVVVDPGDLHAGGHGGLAVGARDGRDGVLSRLEELGDDELAYGAGGLEFMLASSWEMSGIW